MKIVLKAINTLKPEKSQGPDGIHPRLIKEGKLNIIEPLTDLFKQSLEEGTVPKDWRKANIAAIHKKGSRKTQKIIDQLV